MKKTKSMRLAVLAASLLCCSLFTVPAYAQSSEPQEETQTAQEPPAETESQPETQNPFSTDGTGTVVDNATDEDGKEFYTITTPDENIFYLVIDKQKTTDNVYFLNAVTEADLLPLAEKSEEETETPAPEPESEPEPKTTETPEEVVEPEPDAPDSNLFAILLVGAVALIGGGAGYYLKIYKPKHQAPDLEDDYCEYEEETPEEVIEEDTEEPDNEDMPHWDMDGEQEDED